MMTRLAETRVAPVAVVSAGFFGFFDAPPIAWVRAGDGVIRSAWTDRKARMYSDHLPVIADVVFPE